MLAEDLDVHDGRQRGKGGPPRSLTPRLSSRSVPAAQDAEMRVLLLLGSVVLILMAYSVALLRRMLREIHHGKDASEQSQQQVQTPQLTRSANKTSGFKL